MARIPALSREEAPPEARAAYDRNLDAHGVVLNSTGIYAYRPTIQAGAGALARGIAESGLLPPRVKVLVNLRVAALAGCPFWVDLHAAGGSAADVSPDAIAALPRYRESDLFTPAERAALALADAATATPAAVDDDLFAEARGHYSPEQLVELAAVIALENFRSRFNRVFDVEANGLYCPVPPPAG